MRKERRELEYARVQAEREVTAAYTKWREASDEKHKARMLALTAKYNDHEWRQASYLLGFQEISQIRTLVVNNAKMAERAYEEAERAYEEAQAKLEAIKDKLRSPSQRAIIAAREAKKKNTH